MRGVPRKGQPTQKAPIQDQVNDNTFPLWNSACVCPPAYMRACFILVRQTWFTRFVLVLPEAMGLSKHPTAMYPCRSGCLSTVSHAFLSHMTIAGARVIAPFTQVIRHDNIKGSRSTTWVGVSNTRCYAVTHRAIVWPP